MRNAQNADRRLQGVLFIAICSTKRALFLSLPCISVLSHFYFVKRPLNMLLIFVFFFFLFVCTGLSEFLIVNIEVFSRFSSAATTTATHP